MTTFTLQIILVLVVAFLVGALVGAWLRALHLPWGEVTRITGKMAAKRRDRGGGTSRDAAALRASGLGRKSRMPPADHADEPASADASAGEPDDLKRIKGIGAVLEKRLNELGVTHYHQIAAWTAADIARIDKLLNFKGRIRRENWIQQARTLAGKEP